MTLFRRYVAVCQRKFGRARSATVLQLADASGGTRLAGAATCNGGRRLSNFLAVFAGAQQSLGKTR